MDYFLYSGCSLDASASHYMISLEAVCKALGAHLKDIEDWNCCGASIAYIGGNEMQQIVLNARNLALAEKQGGMDIIAPCSSCYIMMNKYNRQLQEDPKLLDKVNGILAEGGLSYSGSLKVRHILDVLYNDIGVDKIKGQLRKPLTGVKVASYYGCQTTRPFGEYDSVESPTTQDELLAALGAEVVPFDKKVKCCGSGLFLTEIELCARLADDIIGNAKGHGAEVISTACPMCQMNLEVYQPRISKILGKEIKMPVVFITQLMAVALGLDPKKDAALDRNIVAPESVLRAAAA